MFHAKHWKTHNLIWTISNFTRGILVSVAVAGEMCTAKHPLNWRSDCLREWQFTTNNKPSVATAFYCGWHKSTDNKVGRDMVDKFSIGAVHQMSFIRSTRIPTLHSLVHVTTFFYCCFYCSPGPISNGQLDSRIFYLQWTSILLLFNPTRAPSKPNTALLKCRLCKTRLAVHYTTCSPAKPSEWQTYKLGWLGSVEIHQTGKDFPKIIDHCLCL